MNAKKQKKELPSFQLDTPSLFHSELIPRISDIYHSHNPVRHHVQAYHPHS